MSAFNAMVEDFLAQKRIAVVGVSRTKEDAANSLYRKFKGIGYTVYAINPNAQTFDGDPCYPDVKSTPEKPDAAMVVTTPAVSEQVMRQCVEAGIRRVWMHCSMMASGTSVSPKAVEYGQANGVSVIAGGCPNMFCQADIFHKMMRWMMRTTGQLPR